MRVAVRHTDPSHPNGAWFAFEQGRIVGFTDPRDGVSVTPEEVADALLRRSKERYPEPEYEHRLERLHVTGQDENGNDVSAWFPDGESELPVAPEGQVVAEPITIDQEQVQEGGAV